MKPFAPHTKRGKKQLLMVFCGFFAVADPALAQTWTQTQAPNMEWVAMASSADGSKLVAAALPSGPFLGVVYTSTNSGITWMPNNLPSYQSWESVASSADGVNFAAASYGELYISTNSGSSWVLSTNAPSESWTSIAFSSDGTKLVAVADPGQIYTSTNSGNTWTATITPSNNWTSVASSADGSKLVALAFNGPIYLSTNSGLSWTSNNIVAYWRSVACSVDGVKLVAVADPGQIYTSTNSGVTWSPHFILFAEFGSVASSADGTKLIAVGSENSTPIYVSTNAGISWIQQTNPPANVLWNAAASSADGNEILAATYTSDNNGGGIYISHTTSSPTLNITPLSTNLTISWTVPSTNFVLQQNSDLTTTNWVTLTNTPTLIFTNLQYQVTLSPFNCSGFYRLAIP